MHSISSKRLINILRRFPRTKILVIGDVMLDEYIWGKVTRISPEAPVPVVNVHRETSMPGGAANVARNVSAISGGVALSGFIGNDLAGSRLVKLLRGENVDTSGLIRDRNSNTILKTRVIAHSQQVVRIDKERNTQPKAKDLNRLYRSIKNIIPEIKGVIVEDYGKGLITQELVYFLVDICNKYKKPIVVDPKKGHFLDYTGVTTVTPNLEEALAIVGLDHNGEYIPEKVEEVSRLIMDKWSLDGVLITLGEHGMSLLERNKPPFKIPTMAREVYDVSGAGDTVVGVFSTALCSGASMREAALLSNMAAGIVVGKVGTAVATTEELLGVIKRNGK